MTKALRPARLLPGQRSRGQVILLGLVHEHGEREIAARVGCAASTICMLVGSTMRRVPELDVALALEVLGVPPRSWFEVHSGERTT